MLIMANYKIMEGQTSLILVSTPTDLAITVLLSFDTKYNSLAQKISQLGKTLISAQLPPD